MIDLSKKKLKCGSNVFDFLVGKLPSKNFIFFDVGARNGSFILPENFSKYTTLYGFEPNIDEYKKLVNFKTDAIKFGIKEPKFKKKKVLQFCTF